MSDGRMTFQEVLSVCARQESFVREFDRLSGHDLSTIGRRSGLDAMIDEATGRDAEAFTAFIAFVYEFVWTRLPEIQLNGRANGGDQC